MTTSENQAGWLVLVVAGVIAVGGASSRATSWNDGSRLATVESLAERGTWAIDASPFVQVPPPESGRPSPYPADDRLLQAFGTKDRLWIAGHFYSDKSPVPALPLAGLYALLRVLGFPSVADDPAWFCWILCLAAAGLAYVVAVWCVWRLGRPLGLGIPARLLLTASFGLATVAWTYSRSVNNHILLLAVASAIWLQLAWLSRGAAEQTPGRFALLGFLAGLAYTIDLGAGPPLAALTFLLACYRGKSVRLAGLFVACALPWALLHHGITFALAGTWKPANAVPEYLAWPGSPFHRGNMSGVWGHAGAGAFALYALDLLVGKKGFLLHNLPLLLALVTLPFILRRVRERAEVLTAATLCAAIWLVYSAGSTNSSGMCISVRWFVPLLAPGFFLLAVILRDLPATTRDLVVLSAGGLGMAGLAAWVGPWWPYLVPGYWFVVGGTLVAWGGMHFTRRSSGDTATDNRRPGGDGPLPGTEGYPAAA
jgi:hypothetical protein